MSKVTETIYRREEYSYDHWNLQAYQKFLSECIEKIPEEFREQAVIEFNCEHQGYGDYAVETHIYYERPKTKEELNEEARQRYAEKSSREKAERTMYENLKKKFEGGQ